jgi:hypothetical protein
MPRKKYLVTLNDEEREQLEQLLHSGTHATRKVTRARVLLKAAEGWECQAQDNATSSNVRAPHAALPRDESLHCSANARGVSPSRAPCGRS